MNTNQIINSSLVVMCVSGSVAMGALTYDNISLYGFNSGSCLMINGLL